MLMRASRSCPSLSARVVRVATIVALAAVVVGIVPANAIAEPLLKASARPSLPVHYPKPMRRPRSASVHDPISTPTPSPKASSAHPTASPSPSPAPSAPPVELIGLRTRDTETFRNSDGSFTTMVGHVLHYRDDSGAWAPVDLTFRNVGGEHVMDRHDLVVKVTGSGVSAAEKLSGKGIFWPTAAAPTVTGRNASFKGELGLTWTYSTRKSGIKLWATVSSPLGARTLTFPYVLLGGAAPLSVVNGALESDVFSVPAPVAIGADDGIYPLGSWRLEAGHRVSLVMDDSQVPVSAFPYQLDPTTTFHITAEPSMSASAVW